MPFVTCSDFFAFHAAVCGEARSPAFSVEIHQCEEIIAVINNITVLSHQLLSDDKGKSVDLVRRGSANLLVAGEMINAGETTIRNIQEAFRTLVTADEWRKSKLNTPDGMIVGLVEETEDMLILFEGKWWFFRVYNDRLAIFDVEVIINRKNTKVATVAEGCLPRVSVDQETVRYFANISKKTDVNRRSQSEMK